MRLRRVGFVGAVLVAWGLAGFVPAAIGGAIPAPIAYWSFDDDPDRQVNDLTGNSNSGLWFGAGNPPPDFSSDVPAALGSGRSLGFEDPRDARTNEHYVALDMSLSGTGALPQMTAAGWFKTSYVGPPTGETVQEGNWAIVDFDRSEYFDLYVRDTDGRIGFSTNHGGAGADIHDMEGTTSGLNDGQWHHVAVVYDGTDKHIYLDGAPDGTAANPHGGSALGSTSPRFGYLGDGSEATVFNTGTDTSGTHNNGRNDYYYDGRIDDVAVWDTALTGTDIAALAAGTASPADGLGPLPTLAPGGHVVNFESLAGVPENSLIANRIPGMTFDGATLVFAGSPRFGFGGAAGDDIPLVGEPAGGAMITDIADVNATPDPVGGPPFSPITVTWNGAAVTDLMFQVVDIDGNHQFRGSVYDAVQGGNLLETLTINAGDLDTGDAIATLIDFSPVWGVRRLEFEVVNGSVGNSGFSADNFRFIVVPEPATLTLLALGGLAVAARRRRPR
ncbi:MAG: LamG domain-containing protein [Planctomycetota bacterium]